MDTQYLLAAVYNHRSSLMTTKIKNIIASNLLQKKSDTMHMNIQPYTGFLAYGTYINKKWPSDMLLPSLSSVTTDTTYDTQSLIDA